MGFFDALNHLFNFFLPAVGLAALAAVLAKLLWRHELASLRWRALFQTAATLTLITTVLGLVIQGRDGRMSTYALMVVGCATGLWWRGFGPGRPR